MKEQMDFGKLSDGRKTRIWRLYGKGGFTVDISDYGGKVVRVYAPDRFGNLADVTLGWNTAAEYEKYGFSMGTIIGRYGNRIANGRFTLDGVDCVLPVNEKTATRNCNLHGGPEGWNTKIWDAKGVEILPDGTQRIELSLISPDGDMGFPGTVSCKVTYAVSGYGLLSVDYEATTDKPTVINPTHHGYWNLAGEASGDVLKHELQILADLYTKTDAGLIPTEKAPVDGTGFDFREPRAIGSKSGWMAATDWLKAMDNWYDHNFFLRGAAGEMKKAAMMRDPASGRAMEVWTTEPCMQIYGAQNMDGTMPAKAPGAKLVKFAGMALETQHAPDSPNRPDFPSTVLRPGETFRSRTEYRFYAD